MGATESAQRKGESRLVLVTTKSPFERGYRIGEQMLEDILNLYEKKAELYKQKFRSSVLAEWDTMAEQGVDAMEDFAPTSYAEFEGLVAGCQAQWVKTRGQTAEEPPFLKMVMRLAVDYELLMAELHARAQKDFKKHTSKMSKTLASMKEEHKFSVSRQSDLHTHASGRGSQHEVKRQEDSEMSRDVPDGRGAANYGMRDNSEMSRLASEAGGTSGTSAHLFGHSRYLGAGDSVISNGSSASRVVPAGRHGGFADHSLMDRMASSRMDSQVSTSSGPGAPQGRGAQRNFDLSEMDRMASSRMGTTVTVNGGSVHDGRSDHVSIPFTPEGRGAGVVMDSTMSRMASEQQSSRYLASTASVQSDMILPPGRQAANVGDYDRGDMSRLASSNYPGDHSVRYASSNAGSIMSVSGPAPAGRMGMNVQDRSDMSRLASSHAPGKDSVMSSDSLVAGNETPAGRYGMQVTDRSDMSRLASRAPGESVMSVGGDSVSGPAARVGVNVQDRSDMSRLASSHYPGKNSTMPNDSVMIGSEPAGRHGMQVTDRSDMSRLASHAPGESVMYAGGNSVYGPATRMGVNVQDRSDMSRLASSHYPGKDSAMPGGSVMIGNEQPAAGRHGMQEQALLDTGCTGIATLYGGMHPHHRVISAQTNDESPSLFDDAKHDVVILHTNSPVSRRALLRATGFKKSASTTKKSKVSTKKSATVDQGKKMSTKKSKGSQDSAPGDLAPDSDGDDDDSADGNKLSPELADAAERQMESERVRIDTWMQGRVNEVMIPLLQRNTPNFMRDMNEKNIFFSSEDVAWDSKFFTEPCASMIYTHPAMGAYMGLNAYGLSILWQYIDTGERGDVSGCEAVVTNTLIREMLLLPSAKHALAYLHVMYTEDLIGVPNTFTLSDPSFIYCCEVGNASFFVEEAHPVQGGTVVHGNHLLLDPGVGPPPVGRDVSLMKPSNSQWRVKHAMERPDGKWPTGSQQCLFLDHFPYVLKFLAMPPKKKAGGPPGSKSDRLKARLFDISFPELEGQRPAGAEQGAAGSSKDKGFDEWNRRAGCALSFQRRGLLGVEPPPPMQFDFANVIINGQLSLRRTKELIQQALADEGSKAPEDPDQIEVFADKPPPYQGKEKMQTEQQWRARLTVEQYRFQLEKVEFIMEPWAEELLVFVFDILYHERVDDLESEKAARLWSLQQRIDQFCRKLHEHVQQNKTRGFISPAEPAQRPFSRKLIAVAEKVCENEDLTVNPQEVLKFIEVINEHFEVPLLWFGIANEEHAQEKKILRLEQNMGDFSSWAVKKMEKPPADVTNEFAASMGLDEWVEKEKPNTSDEDAEFFGNMLGADGTGGAKGAGSDSDEAGDHTAASKNKELQEPEAPEGKTKTVSVFPPAFHNSSSTSGSGSVGERF
eukprot:g3766.t1